jgi:hypothetical protein
MNNVVIYSIIKMPVDYVIKLHNVLKYSRNASYAFHLIPTFLFSKYKQYDENKKATG